MTCGLFASCRMPLTTAKVLPKACFYSASAFMLCLGLPCQSPGDVTSVTHQGEKDPPSFILTFSPLPKENMMAMANVACVDSGLFQEEGSQE